MNLYTVDLSTDSLIQNLGINRPCEKTPYEKKKIKVHHNLMRDKLMDIIEKKRVTYSLWNDDKDITIMR